MKKVRFNLNAEYSPAPLQQNVEKEALYLTRHDYARIEFENKEEYQEFEEGRSGPDACIRGLEVKLPGMSRRRAMNRRRALCAVLEEQERQKGEGMNDDDIMAEIYGGYCCHLWRQAREVGVRDAEEAKAICLEKSKTQPLYQESFAARHNVRTVPRVRKVHVLA